MESGTEKENVKVIYQQNGLRIIEVGQKMNFLGEKETVKELHGSPGFIFDPTKQELVTDFLKNKLFGQPVPNDFIQTVDVYSQTPDQLPLRDVNYLMKGVWYFYTVRPNDNLANNNGYYSISAEEEIFKDGKLVGFMQTLNYYKGKPSEGKKTNWIIHEFRVNPDIIPSNELHDGIRAKISNFVVCELVDCKKQKSSSGRQKKFNRKNESSS